MPWFVYLVECRDGSLYAGMTNDLDARVAKHNAGTGARYTRSRRPVRLAFSRRVKDRSRALRLEAALKKLGRAEKLALVEAGARARLPRLAKRAPRPARPPPVSPSGVEGPRAQRESFARTTVHRAVAFRQRP